MQITASPFVFDASTTLILELHSGEGGKDSKLFTSDLFDTYLKYAANCGLQAEVLLQEDGHAMAKITGKGVWKAFKTEPGKHACCRVPVTERNGRRQTSLVTVAALPLPPEHIVEKIKDQDLDIKFQCAGGPGGQHVNKKSTSCRATHKPTGLSVYISTRDQDQSKKEAVRILTHRVNESKRLKAEHEYNSSRKDQMLNGGDKIGSRGDKIRTYNFCNNRITDHNLQKKTSNIKEFMKGRFNVLFDQGEHSEE